MNIRIKEYNHWSTLSSQIKASCMGETAHYSTSTVNRISKKVLNNNKLLSIKKIARLANGERYLRFTNGHQIECIFTHTSINDNQCINDNQEEKKVHFSAALMGEP